MNVSIVNDTHGAVTDAEAQRAGRAAIRWYALYTWAVNANDSGFLEQGFLSEPRAVNGLFGSDLDHIAQAKSAGTTFRMDPYRLTQVRVVSLSSDLQGLVASRGGSTGQTAVVLQLRGPEREAIGNQVVNSAPAGSDRSVVVYGMAKDDPDLGLVWHASGFDFCDSLEVRSLCA